jgi:hypothetical protein
MRADSDQQMPEHDEGALAWQELQAQQFARARIDDTQHGEGRTKRRAHERQVQRPGVAHLNEAGPLSFAPPA